MNETDVVLELARIMCEQMEVWWLQEGWRRSGMRRDVVALFCKTLSLVRSLFFYATYWYYSMLLVSCVLCSTYVD